MVTTGRNSLLLYFGKFLLPGLLSALVIGQQDLLVRVTDLATRLGDPSDVLAAVTSVLWVLLAVALHRRGWYLRV